MATTDPLLPTDLAAALDGVEGWSSPDQLARLAGIGWINYYQRTPAQALVEQDDSKDFEPAFLHRVAPVG